LQSNPDQNTQIVILAHGLACTHSAFDPLWNDANLQKSLYMVRYDTRGHGQTDKPATAAGYNSSRYAQDVEAVVKAFSLKRPFFAGWSLAGAIAVDLASVSSSSCWRSTYDDDESQYYPPTLAGLPFSGFISFAGLPSMDLIPSVTTDLVRSFVPGLIDSANATNAVQTRINFAGTLSSQQTSVPFDVLTQWVGSASYLPPVTANFVLTRTQDNTNFFKVGKAGWPTLILFGDADDQVIPTVSSLCIGRLHSILMHACRTFSM
jgi:pimeloyl-ACP methyl ester carboxylesterase